MAHEITKTDAFGSTQGREWHGLGVTLKTGLTAEEAFTSLGLGWTTELGTLRCHIGNDADGKEIWKDVPDFRGNVRQDNKDILGIVGKDYRPIQNKEMAAFADLLAGADKAVTVETGGSLRGGRRVFVLVKLPKDTEVLDGDVLKNYICISNGHDGVNAFNVFHTPVRVVCANTLRAAEASMKGARFTHTGDIAEKIELARAALGIVIGQSERFAETARKLAKVSLTEAKIADYFDRVYGRTYGDEMSKDHTDETISAWNGNLTAQDNTVKSTEGTAWQAMNAVTYFHDHQRGRFKSVDEGSEGRIHSNLFGTSYLAKQIAWKEALELLPSAD